MPDPLGNVNNWLFVRKPEGQATPGNGWVLLLCCHAGVLRCLLWKGRRQAGAAGTWRLQSRGLPAVGHSGAGVPLPAADSVWKFASQAPVRHAAHTQPACHCCGCPHPTCRPAGGGLHQSLQQQAQQQQQAAQQQAAQQQHVQQSQHQQAAQLQGAQQHAAAAQHSRGPGGTAPSSRAQSGAQAGRVWRQRASGQGCRSVQQQLCGFAGSRLLRRAAGWSHLWPLLPCPAPLLQWRTWRLPPARAARQRAASLRRSQCRRMSRRTPSGRLLSSSTTIQVWPPFTLGSSPSWVCRQLPAAACCGRLRCFQERKQHAANS